MKKQVYLTIFCALTLLQANAQTTEKSGIAITGGVSSGSMRISGVDNHIINNIQGDNIFGMEGGIFTKIKVNPFYIKPAAVILYKRGTVDVFNSEGVAYSQSDFKMTSLEIPLLFGMNVIGPFNAEIGLVYHHVLGVTTRYSGYSVSVPRNGFGYRAGVNVELDRFALGISYQAIRNVSSTQGTFDLPGEMIVGAAYTFGVKPGMAPYGRR